MKTQEFIDHITTIMTSGEDGTMTIQQMIVYIMGLKLSENEKLHFAIRLGIVMSEADWMNKAKSNAVVQSPFVVKSTDKVFYDSPDAGQHNCVCSRCYQQITHDPVIRCYPDEGEHGHDPDHTTEFRYCQKCSELIGITF